MKALITVALIVDVDNEAEAEEFRDAVDRSVWHGMHEALAAHDVTESAIEGLLMFYPATMSLERSLT